MCSAEYRPISVSTLAIGASSNPHVPANSSNWMSGKTLLYRHLVSYTAAYEANRRAFSCPVILTSADAALQPNEAEHSFMLRISLIMVENLVDHHLDRIQFKREPATG